MRWSRLKAFLLSLWTPGLGQLYAGRWVRGLVLAALAVAIGRAYASGLLGRTPSSLVAFFLLTVAVRIFAPVDAAILDPDLVGRSWYQRWPGLLTLALAMPLLSFLLAGAGSTLRVYRIPSSGMKPTLFVGDRIVVALDAYDSRPPGRGDLVVYELPEEGGGDRLHRVVAVGGETIELRDRRVYVDGVAMDEPWVVHRDRVRRSGRLARRDQLAPTTVPPGQLFVMGDNRDFSWDSRFFGPVAADSVKGAPLYVCWGADRSRIGKILE